MRVMQQEQDEPARRMDNTAVLVRETRQLYATPRLVCYASDPQPTARMLEVKAKLLKTAIEKLKPT